MLSVIPDSLYKPPFRNVKVFCCFRESRAAFVVCFVLCYSFVCVLECCVDNKWMLSAVGG